MSKPTAFLNPMQRRDSLIRIPEGAAGTRETLKHMRNFVRQAKRDPELRIFATRLIAQCPPKAWMTELRTLFNWVRDNIRYTLDTNDLEVIQTPRRTLELKTGDCDDLCILLACLIELCGHPAWFLALAFNNESQYSHVIVQTSTVDGDRAVSLDPSESHPMGWFPPGVTATMRADI